MKIFQFFLVIVVLLTTALDASAWGRKKKQNKTQAFATAAPKIDPLHDPKVLSSFKNSNEIKAEVENIDHLDKAALKKQLGQVHNKREKQSQALNHLSQNELADIKARKKKLQEAMTALEEQGLEPTSAKGLMNKVMYMVKDTQMKQVKSDEAAIEARVKKLND